MCKIRLLKNMTTSKIMRGFSLASEMASLNNTKHSKHGAVMMKGGKIIGYGYNTIEPHPTIMGSGVNCHAEVTSMKNGLRNNRSLYLKQKSYFRGRKGKLWEIRG